MGLLGSSRPSRNGALLTINERLTGHLRIRRPDGKNATEPAAKAPEALMPWKQWIHPITAGNGKEFAEHERVAKGLEIWFSFPRPYSSWERRANENANGLNRQLFPKKTSFENLTDEQVKRVEEFLNNRPGKRLGF